MGCWEEEGKVGWRRLCWDVFWFGGGGDGGTAPGRGLRKVEERMEV